MQKITLLFICLLSVLNISAEIYSGSCGDNARYSLDTETGLLSITGTGAMYNYSYASGVPWNSQSSSITTIEIADGVTSIGELAFWGCYGLTSVTIPNSVTSIGEYAFSNCTALASLTIPNSVTSIGNYAFYGCSGLTSLAIPNSVRIIGEWAFDGCSGLTSVTIPNNVISIGKGVFYGCSGLASVTIPNSVIAIERGAFFGCQSLTSVEIPNSVISIGNEAFYRCSGLTSVEIPNSVISMGDDVFSYCSGLTSVIIPNSVTSIGERVFYGCSGLTEVTIPNSVTAIGTDAFSDCSNLTKVFLNCNAIVSRSYSSGSTLGSIFGNQVEVYVLEEEITAIGNYAFYHCSGLTSVTIPNSVTSIGGPAFSGCSNLTKVILNSNAVVSKSYSSTSTLGTIFGSQVIEYILEDEITAIGKYAFYNCSDVTSITIPDNVTSVGDNAFDGTAWYDNLPDGLFYAGKVAYKFKGTMPENTSIIIKDGTVELANGLFNGCTGLTSIYIPSSVKSIGSNALANCSELLDVYCYARKSPAIGSNVFENSDILFAALYVPETSVNGYKATDPWSGFGTILALSGEYPDVPGKTKCATPAIEYENGKLSFSCETEDVEYVYSTSSPSTIEKSGSDVSLPKIITVSVYATKSGYEDSDTATMDIDVSGTCSGIRGDVNLDNEIGMPDVMFIVNYILNGKFPDEE